MLDSVTCRQEHFRSDWYKQWVERYSFETILHRKLWEWCAISQALDERGFLTDGKKGLCFAAGQEPLVSMFASRGCQIEATDLAGEMEESEVWKTTGQHSTGLDILHQEKLIDRKTFEERVTFYPADMRDLSGLAKESYDFIWSSCALEHLGSLDLGMTFVSEAMELLKPGGIAVHTTEINVGSLDETVETGGAVIYRKKDIEGLDAKLRRNGMALERLDLFPGSEIHDRQFDYPPYGAHGRAHVKLELDGHVCTSQLLIAYR